MGIRKKKSVIEQAIDQATEFAESVRPQLESALVTAKEKAGPALADARERAVELSTEAREKAAPLLADARDRAVELSAEAREKATPLIAEGRTKAATGAAVGAAYAAEKAAHGKELAATKLAELKAEPEPEPKKGGKLRKIVLFSALTGLAAFAVKKLTADKSSDNWQSSYTPTPPSQTAAPSTPASPAATAAAAVEEDDRAAASPDEALSDATDEPHPPTTPDAPAEVIDIDPDNRA